MFRTQDPNTEGWDGTFKGSPADQGVYVWFLRYVFNGQTYKRSGDVLLMR
jgi:hypothetical protein